MDDKSLKTNGVNPAAWPVQSLQSRAAARLFLAQRKPRVSPALAYYERRSQASKEFFLLHDREPVAGDLLRYDEIQATTGVDFCDWAVYIERDTLPLGEGQEVERDGYRLKVQGGRICRTLTAEEQNRFDRGIWPSLWSPVKDGVWWVSPLSNPEGRWRRVEEEAWGLETRRHHPTQPLPTIPAVMFLGIVHGKHACKEAAQG